VHGKIGWELAGEQRRHTGNREKMKDTTGAAGTKILVADDNLGGRDLLRAILEHDGHTVIEASDGEEALDVLRDTVPDLVILDIHMPQLDGFEVLARIRDDPRFDKTPVLALTASATPANQERILSAGFTNHFTKPIGPAKLRQIVAEMLHSHGAHTT
jgi:CheY-like chemotaxis protein